MARPLQRLGNVFFSLFLAAVAAVVLGMTVLPPILRYQTYVVLSGSMEPTIHVGSVVVATATNPDDLKIGDIITYSRAGEQETVTHRIVQIKGSAQGKVFTTQGDANGSPDLGDIRFDRLAGKVQLSIPYLGYAFSFMGSPTMRLLLIVVPGVLLLGSWLWEIWRPDPHTKGPDQEVPTNMAPAATEPVAKRGTSKHTIGIAADAAAVPLRQ